MNTMDSNSSDEITAALEAMLASKQNPEKAAWTLFTMNYERTKTRNPELAEMLRACAIPRALNAQLIGVLRYEMDETETNQRLLSDLLTFSSVLTVPVPGSSDFTYHDSTRQLLWQDLASN